MSNIPYAAGTIVNTTFDASSVSNIINNLEGHLVTAGWTVAASATDDFTLESGATPAGLLCRVRLYAGSSSAKVSFRDQSETRIGLDHYLGSGFGDFRVIACQYQFFVLLPGDSTTARSFVAGGVLYTEQAFIWEAIWSQGNGISDTDVGTARTTFRTIAHCRPGGSPAHTWQSFNGYSRNGGTSVAANSGRGDQKLLVPMAQGAAGPGYFTTVVWYDEGGLGADPAGIPARLAWCTGDAVGYASVKGTLWGSAVTTGSPASIDETTVGGLDGKDWYAITDPAGDPVHDSRGNGNLWTITGN